MLKSYPFAIQYLYLSPWKSQVTIQCLKGQMNNFCGEPGVMAFFTKFRSVINFSKKSKSFLLAWSFINELEALDNK